MNLKRITGGILGIAILLSTVGCGTKTNQAVVEWKTSGESMTLWAESSTVKIKQDDKGKTVKTAKDKQILKVNMARNESEGAQLMIYAKQKIDSYTVAVTDLASNDGIIPAENVTIYQLKYQTAEAETEGNPEYAEGEIPDPMLPFETAVEYKENTIEKGKNQAIFFDVKTEKATPAGIYSAAITVEAGNETYRIPLEVTVYDVTYPDTASLKTAFTYYDRDVFATAELDASDEQTTAYFETLLAYNMSSFLPFEGEGGIEKYKELVRKYYNYPGFSAYRLYYDTTAGTYNGLPAPYDAELLKQYIEGIVEISIEDHVNYLDKAYTYFYTVADEPNTDEKFQKAKDSLIVFEAMIQDADAELRAKYAGTEAYTYYDSVLSDTLVNIPNVLPGTLDMSRVKQYEIENYTFVPLIDALDKESSREYYKVRGGNKNIWSYMCVAPKYPYPSAHTDDYVVGLRLTGWMSYDYSWDGFLYWSVASYVEKSNGDVTADPWTTMATGFKRPGDARFYYPGAKYGLDNPCPSLRTIAWRDGVDDYSLIQAVENTYQEYGMSAEEVLKELFEDVYTGVIPTTDSELFEETRAKLFHLITELKENADIVFTGVNVEFTTATVTLKKVKEDAVLIVDGKEAKPDKEGNYTFKVDLTKQTTFKYEVKLDGKKTSYTRELLSGKLGVVNGFEKTEKIEDLFFSSAVGYQTEVNNAKEFVKNGEKSVHISMNKDKQDVLPYFAIAKDSDLIGGSWKDIKSFMFYIYNAGEEACEMNVTYYTTGETSVSNVTLAPGEWTPINITIPVNLKNVETIQEFDFNFEKGTAVDLYIDNFTTVEKGE